MDNYNMKETSHTIHYSKNDYLYYIIIFASIYGFFTYTDIIHAKNIVPLIIASIFIYYLIYKKREKENINIELNEEILQEIHLDEYPFIKTNIEVVKCIIKLKNMKYINRQGFIDLLEKTNDFFHIYLESKETNFNDNLFYENAKEKAKDILNTINSYGATIKYYPDLPMDTRILPGIIETDLPHLIQCQNKMKHILTKYLIEMGEHINKMWFNEHVNINISPVYPDEVPAYNTKSDNFNVY